MTLQDTKEKLKRFGVILEGLQEANETIPILVEGKRDVRALENLGLDGVILVVHRGKTLLEISEDIADLYEEVILLLDWDRKGRQLAQRIKSNLISLGVKVNDDYNHRIFSLAAKETKEVEGLDSYFRRLSKSSKRYRLDKYNRATGFAEKRGRHP